MILRKEVELNICHDEVFDALMEASPFDKISIILRLARTISLDDIKEIKGLLPLALNEKVLVPIKQLNENLHK